jgi:hypothetical protein
MKTKLPVRRNHKPTEQEMTARKAVHVLSDITDDFVILCTNVDIGVYLVASVLDEESLPDWDEGQEKLSPGTVQYQLSDGLPDHRNDSLDYFTLADALDGYNAVVANGSWQAFYRRNRYSKS